MDKIILYTTNCPKCKVLEKKLENKNVEFEIVDNIDKVLEIADRFGIMSAPILEVNDNVMEFNKAVEFVDNMGVSEDEK